MFPILLYFFKQPDFPFEYGRVDCGESPELPEDELVGLPPGNLNVKGFLDFFSSAFNLNAVGAVALISAHNIGSMKKSGSGYTGSWKEDRPGDKVRSTPKLSYTSFD